MPKDSKLKLELDKTKLALARAEGTIAMLEDWLRKVLKPCPSCGMPLQLVDWNGSAYMLTCDNSNCNHWRQPAGNIKKEDLTKIVGVLKFKEGKDHAPA